MQDVFAYTFLKYLRDFYGRLSGTSVLDAGQASSSID
jgi:hypothetical protein